MPWPWTTTRNADLYSNGYPWSYRYECFSTLHALMSVDDPRASACLWRMVLNLLKTVNIARQAMWKNEDFHAMDDESWLGEIPDDGRHKPIVVRGAAFAILRRTKWIVAPDRRDALLASSTTLTAIALRAHDSGRLTN